MTSERIYRERLLIHATQRNWSALDKAAAYVTDKPLPQSNSDIAKELRVVKVLAVLADTIQKHLLQPTYQPPEENYALNQILYHLASVEPKREKVLRGMLLAALEDQRDNAEEQLSEFIVEEVMKRQGVADVVRPEFYDGFVGSLENILSDVQDIWQKVQYSTQVFESSFEGTQVADFEWKVAEPQQDNPSQGQAHEDDNDVVMLFPIIFLVGNEKRPITTGTIVRQSRISALIKEERRNSRPVDSGPSRPR